MLVLPHRRTKFEDKSYLRNEQDGLKRVDAVGVGRGSLAKLNRRDARTPHVRTAIVGGLADHLCEYTANQ